jgi:hypothetical protein
MVSAVTQLLSLFISLKVKVKSLYLFEQTPECVWVMEVRFHRVVYGSAAWAAEQLWTYWKIKKFLIVAALSGF